MQRLRHQQSRLILRGSKGFTLIELILVVGIIAILFSMATINLVRAQHVATVSATVDQLIADMRAQQTKAMTGGKDTNGNPNSYGIHVLSNGYTLFQGTSDTGDPSDFAVNPTGITFTSNLPSSWLVFSERSGEFSNYVNGTTYTITVKNTNGTEQKVLTINKYGIVTSIQ
jgi:prepilin-type N-terminal cleavage/methylation domain-containing protein